MINVSTLTNPFDGRHTVGRGEWCKYMRIRTYEHIIKRQTSAANGSLFVFRCGEPPRASEPPRARVVPFLLYGAEPPRASIWGIRARLFSFLLRGISPLRLRSGRNDKFVRGLLTAKPSVGRDALVPPHNVHSWFRFAPALLYNVISTGVRTTVRTQWRNPPRKGFFVRVRK